MRIGIRQPVTAGSNGRQVATLVQTEAVAMGQQGPAVNRFTGTGHNDVPDIHAGHFLRSGAQPLEIAEYHPYGIHLAEERVFEDTYLPGKRYSDPAGGRVKVDPDRIPVVAGHQCRRELHHLFTASCGKGELALVVDVVYQIQTGA